MNAISGSTASSRFDAATRNQEAINADIVRQVSQAPADLRQIFRTEGYDGVVRWSARYTLIFSRRSLIVERFYLGGKICVTRWCGRSLTQCPRVLKHVVSDAFCGQLRVHWLGLLLDETREQVILCCDRCLALNIPVDVIASEALRVKNALD